MRGPGALESESANGGWAMDDPADGFAEFVQRTQRRLLSLAWSLVGDWARAQDLTQTVLLRIWPRWESLADPEAYAQVVMVRTYLRWRRRRWLGEIPTHQLPDAPAPGNQFADAEVRQSLVRAMSALTARQRAVVTLRYLADLTEAQTANVLGCSIGAVKSHTSRALATLRDHPDLVGLLSEDVRQ
jgi:RNA polymerase sigma-70 factor (sigma-E family)